MAADAPFDVQCHFPLRRFSGVGIGEYQGLPFFSK